jgi:hypothetical protein
MEKFFLHANQELAFYISLINIKHPKESREEERYFGWMGCSFSWFHQSRLLLLFFVSLLKLLASERISGSYGTGHRSSSDPGSSTSRSRFAQHPIHRHGRKASLPPDPDGPSHLTKRHEQRQTRPLS